MRRILAFIVIISLSACGIDFKVGPTDVIVEDGAVPWEAFSRDFRCFQLYVEAEIGPDWVEVFDTTLEIHPSYAPLDWRVHSSVTEPAFISGLFYKSHIRVLDLGDTMFQSAIPHEFIQHRIPWVLTGDSNASHSKEWVDVQNKILNHMRNRDVKTTIPCNSSI